jgi:hypothetical protein
MKKHIARSAEPEFKGMMPVTILLATLTIGFILYNIIQIFL